MRQGKKIAFLSSILTFLVLMSSNVFGQGVSISTFNPLRNILDVFLIQMPQTWGVIYIKFWLWLLVYALLLIATRRVFHQDQNQLKYGKIIALAVSFISIGGMPNSLVTAVGRSFSFFFGLIFILIIPLLIWIYTREMESSFARGLVYFVIGLFLTILTPSFLSGFKDAWAVALVDWMMAGGAIMMLIGLVMMAMGGVSGAAGAAADAGVGDGIRNLWNGARDAIAGPSRNRREIAERIRTVARDVDAYERSVNGFRDLVANTLTTHGSPIPAAQRPIIMGTARTIRDESRRLRDELTSIATDSLMTNRGIVGNRIRGNIRNTFSDADASFTAAGATFTTALIDFYVNL